MAVPKKKTSKSRRNQRRAHDAIKFTAATESCPACGEVKLRHRVCMSCGDYRGVHVLDVKGNDS
jgi:large subunit ribosomal protein L32